jgi:hypothetical protein
MNRIYPVVRSETVFDLIEPGERPVPVDVELSYHAQDPYAVRMTFGPRGNQPVTWLISRTLLTCGMRHRAGEGDIRLWPLTSDAALLELRSAEQAAIFRFPVPELEDFLLDTHELVALGSESAWLDIDAALYELFLIETGFGGLDTNER